MRKEYDFSNARRAKDVPHLSKLQTETKNKTCVMIMLDNEVLQRCQATAESRGISYQTLINNILVKSMT